MGDDGEVITASVRFDIFTREWNDENSEWQPSALKAMRSPDGKMRLQGIASSTIKDLHGDTMLITALEDMERAASSGLTIFGNHSYNVPEDVYGVTENAHITQAGTVDKNGDPIYDLRFGIVVNDENPRAVQTFKAIEKGSKLGISIGAMIPEGGAVRDKKSGAYTIAHVDLLETSIVGIPANPRSWVENAMKSLSIPARKAEEPSLDEVNLSGEDVEATTEVAPDIIDAASCSDCGHGKGDGGGCQNSFHSKDVEPDVTDAKIRVIEIDTGDDSGASSSQGASQSEPAPIEPEGAMDGENAADVAEVLSSADEIITTAKSAMASLDPEVTTLVRQLLELTNGLHRELAVALGREQEAIAAKAIAERQRDEIVQLSGKLITGTNTILNKLADQPVGRRAVYREASDSFGDLEGIYSRDFLTLLRSNNT